MFSDLVNTIEIMSSAFLAHITSMKLKQFWGDEVGESGCHSSLVFVCPFFFPNANWFIDVEWYNSDIAAGFAIHEELNIYVYIYIYKELNISIY